MAAALGISGSAASRLLASNDEFIERMAMEISNTFADATS